MDTERKEDAIEKIKREISILDLAQDFGFTVVSKGRYYSLKEHDSVMIDQDKNLFTRNSMIENGRKVAGNPIHFYMHFSGEQDKKQAVRALLQRTGALHTVQRSKPIVKKEKEPFALPKKHKGQYKRAFGYLMGRGIDTEVISYMVKNHYLYEEAKHHNIVFVGYDQKGKAQYFFQKGTNTEYPFAGDPKCESKKEVGLYIDNQSTSLVISEAAVDALSVMTLMKRKGNDFRRHNYLVMCGNNIESVRYRLSGLAQPPENIIMALDNDHAGDLYRKEIKDILSQYKFNGNLFDRIPINKDFNDDLQERLGIGKFAEKEDEHDLEMAE